MKKLLMILASAVLLSACGDDKGAIDEPAGPGAEIAIGAETLEVLSTGDFAQGLDEVTVISSGEWRLTGYKTWCVPSAVEGRSGDKVTFTADENTTGAPRSITYTFFCENKAVKLVVTQRRNEVLDLSDDLFEIEAEGRSDIRVILLSSIGTEFKVEYDQPGEEWIVLADQTRSMEQSYLYYSVPANNTYAPRSGRIIVSGSNNELSRTITVKQAQNDELEPEQTSYKLPLEKSMLRMTVWSNIPYEVKIPADATWLTLQAQPAAPTGWTSQELVFELAAADSYRIAAVNLAAKDGSKTIPVGIQQGDPVIFDVPDKVFRDYLLGKTGAEKVKYIEEVDGGYTTTAAGIALTSLDIYQFYPLGKNGCASVVGIENFPNLTNFNGQYSCLRSIDLSKNLKLSDVSKCVTAAIEDIKVPPAVTEIIFGANKLQDFYSGTILTRYWAQRFVAAGENVRTIDVSGNHLQTIDVSECPALTTLKCKQASGYSLRSVTLSESQRGKVSIDDTGATIIYK